VDIKQAREHILKAYKLYQQLDDARGLCLAYRGMAYLAFEEEKFVLAEKYLLEALPIATENEFMHEIFRCYESLSEVELALHNFDAFRKYEHYADSVSDKMVNTIVLKATKELETQYETAEKEHQIEKLTAQKNFMLYFWTSLTIFIVLIFLIIIIYFAQKRAKLALKIKQFEQEKQLIASQSLLIGENQERLRLARDLHDGLGGTLSAVKLSIDMNNPKATKSLELLNEAINEMRRISHHLLPESLERFGLKKAIDDFVSSFDNVRFDYFGENQRFEQKYEISAYRIVYELVNNAIRHSGATNIYVQVFSSENTLSITVEDDGKGFDLAITASGMGLQNIKNRVESLGGRIDISSKLGKGTESNVEFRIG
jgi:signal transduction histidine kinase